MLEGNTFSVNMYLLLGLLGSLGVILDFLRCTVNLVCQQRNGHVQRLGAVLLASDGGKGGRRQFAGNRLKLEDATLRCADRCTACSLRIISIFRHLLEFGCPVSSDVTTQF